MCGIAGASLSPNEKVNTTKLSNELLLGIEERGRHATGVAWNDATGELWISKAAIAASDYVETSSVPQDARNFIAHTRWATQGAASNNANNHPIDVGGIVGIHNGCIYNDDDLFELIGSEKRLAEVDSEAIFALLLHSGLTPGESFEFLKGSAAVSWYETDNSDKIHLARISSSPVVIAYTEAGSLLFASTERAIRRAANATGLVITHVYSLPEGWYHTIENGEITHTENFKTEADRVLSDVERKALNIS